MFCAKARLDVLVPFELREGKMTPEDFTSFSPTKIRAQLPRLLAANLSDAQVGRACALSLHEQVASWTDEEAKSVCHDIAQAGQEGRHYPANPYCREVSRLWASFVLTEQTCRGFEHLEAARRKGPTVILSNHASYIDSPIIDSLLASHDPELANEVVHIAGGKVYQAIFRRIAIVCLDSIPVEQSNSVRPGAGEGNSMSPKELARKVARTIEAALDVLRQGKTLLLYPEGSRTRDGRMRAFLPGVFRYLRVENTTIIPAALEGTGNMMGIAGDDVTPHPCRLTFGEGIDVAGSGGPRRALARAESAILDLLPEEMRPVSLG